jgi:hypothetical protein
MQQARRGAGCQRCWTPRGATRARAATLAGLASLGGLAIVISPALSGAGALPLIHPRHGQPFTLALGDWEGTAGGFPASFSVVLHRRAGVPSYSIGDVVLLRPHSCPTASDSYSVTPIQPSRPTPVGGHGGLGLTHFALGGSFTATRSATLSARANDGSCSGTLTWHMHPRRRPPVTDGTWRLRFNDGESSTFRVLGGGRAAAPIRLPAALTRCNGVSGTVNLFIGASGLATISQPDLRVRMQFGRGRATGRVNAGGSGCSGGPIRLTASLK